MELSEIKETIIKNIDIATKDKGWTLARGVWGFNASKCCCALGSYIVANDMKMENPIDKIRTAFGVDEVWVREFVKGFDGVSIGKIEHKEARELGKEIADQFNTPSFLDVRFKAFEEALAKNETKTEEIKDIKEEVKLDTKEEIKEEIKEAKEIKIEAKKESKLMVAL